MSKTNNIIVWTDVETTGVEYGDALLEVAVLITDQNFNVLDDEGYQAVIYHSPEEVEALKAKTSDFVIDMHSTSGLWDRLPHGVKKQVVDGELTEYLARFATEPKQARMAGNSIRLDLNAVQAHLPTFYSSLHYRSLDVTTLATLAEWNNIKVFRKEKRHEAMADIRESLAELRYLMSHINFIK